MSLISGEYDPLLDQIHGLYADGVREPNEENLSILKRFIDALEAGEIRTAYLVDGVWRVESRVKEGILTGFRLGYIAEVHNNGCASVLTFADKNTFGVQSAGVFVERGSRIVPGGSAVRTGAYIGNSVTIMPPAYVNVGAYVDDGSMVDSHALVGSCAQIGKRVHLSAAAQIGGVLEPIGMRPVIIEDDVMVGGGCGVYEGTLVRERAVLAAGVILTRSTPVYDIVNERIIRGSADSPLEIPAGAVVVPGSRPLSGNSFANEHGLHISCPVIVKYRDDKTDAATALELDLR